jgi:hypothetical protein
MTALGERNGQWRRRLVGSGRRTSITTTSFLINRNQLSGDIVRDVAASCGVAAEAEAEGIRIRGAAERYAVGERLEMAEVFESHPAFLRLRELEALADLANNANARLYLGDRALTTEDTTT